MSDKKDILSVNTDWCIGCWACVWLCPNLFKFNENNRSVVNKQPESNEEIECAKQAESVCPAKAINIIL